MLVGSRIDSKLLLALALAIPCLLAIAVPLYLSGGPTVAGPSASSSGAAAPTPTSPSLAAIAPPRATSSPDARIEPAPRAGEPSPTPASPPTPRPQQSADQGSDAARRTVAAGGDPLTAAVDTLVGGQPGVYGVVIAGEDGTIQYARNADLPYQAASLYKLVLLADVLAGVENGSVPADLQLQLQPEYFPLEGEPEDSYYDASFAGVDVPLDEALFATGAYSSNVAARALLAITDPGSLEATAQAIGMANTHFLVDPTTLPDWPPAPDGADPAALATAVGFVDAQAAEGPINITTPRDMATFFSGLLAGTVISPDVSAKILEILKQQVVDDRFPCLLPSGTAMAHKTGNLDHVVHDVGIIWTPTGPTVLVAMVEGPEDDLLATHVVQRLALIAFDGGQGEVPALPVDSTPVAVCFDGTPS